MEPHPGPGVGHSPPLRVNLWQTSQDSPETEAMSVLGVLVAGGESMSLTSLIKLTNACGA